MGLARLQNPRSSLLLCRLQGESPTEITEQVTEAAESGLSSEWRPWKDKLHLSCFQGETKQSCRLRNLTHRVWVFLTWQLWWPLAVTKTSLQNTSRWGAARSRRFICLIDPWLSLQILLWWLCPLTFSQRWQWRERTERKKGRVS